MSIIDTAVAAIITGMDNNIEMLTACSRLYPRSLAAEIVMPDRDVPGINANACQQPILKEFFRDQDTFVSSVVCFPLLSDHQRKNPKPVIVIPINKILSRIRMS